MYIMQRASIPDPIVRRPVVGANSRANSPERATLQYEEENSLRTLIAASRAPCTLAALLLLHNACAAGADTTALPTGQAISPTAAPGSVFQLLNPNVASAPDYTVGQAETTAGSPDGRQ